MIKKKMKRQFIFTLFLIFLLICIKTQNVESKQADFPVLKGPYLGQEPPGDLPELFMPGIISNCDLHSSVYFSPDGNEVYFTKLLNESWTWNIMYMKQENGQWTPPRFLCKGLTPFLSPDGKTLFFSTQDFNLWKTERSTTGWLEPINLGPVINSSKRQDAPSVTEDGTLYYYSHYRDTSSRVSSLNTKRIPDGPGNVYWVDAKIIEKLKLDELKGRK